MRRRKRKSDEEVELNMAAMLDMAFQLLTFFILTFRPPPAEGQISLKLPPPLAIAGAQSAPNPGQKPSDSVPKAVDSLVITIFSNPQGGVEEIAVGPTNLGANTPRALDQRLKEVFSDAANPFEQVILQIDRRLRYDKLMAMIEVCTKQKMLDGKPLSKLSFVPTAQGG